MAASPSDEACKTSRKRYLMQIDASVTSYSSPAFDELG